MLPPSVLFWGRRVYWASVLLVVTAVRQGRDHGYTVEKLKAAIASQYHAYPRWTVQLHYDNLIALTGQHLS